MKKITNITTISAINTRTETDDYYDSEYVARSVADRFINSSLILDEGSFLGIQISADNICAFSDDASRITPYDFKWIFEEFAAIGNACGDFTSDLYSEGRFVYTIKEPDSRVACHGSAPEFLRMLAANNAILRITSGKEGGHIFISLPKEMPLCIRSLITMAANGATVVRVDKDSDIAPLSSNSIHDILVRLINSLRLSHSDCSKEEKDITSSEYIVEMMNLSVRSYNCLKRAGINNLKDLRDRASCLDSVRNLGKRSLLEIQMVLDELESIPDAQEEIIPEKRKPAIEELNELVGLEEVKSQVRKFAAFARMRKEADLGSGMSMNMSFTGNPGTCKTTVARIIAGILFELGLIESDRIIEAGRADLVAKYEGQTAIKVKNLFDEAKGRVLFIDEAYSLIEYEEGGFGDEAIATIVQEMENRRDSTVVILAGYPDKMKELFDRNPGFKSRVPFQIHFSDYSAEEMVKIAVIEAGRHNFGISPEAKPRILDICSKVNSDPESGAGRFCRNLVQSAILSYALRVYGEGESSPADKILRPEDFSDISAGTPKEHRTMGFAV